MLIDLGSHLFRSNISRPLSDCKIPFVIFIYLILFLAGNISAQKNPCGKIDTLHYGGKIYHTVRIGNQCWLKENLDIGIMIPGTQNQTDNEIIEKYCYANDPKNCEKYGGLYQGNEAMQYRPVEKTRGICPSGWHIPSKKEFEILYSNVDKNGNALKEVNEGVGNGAGTNASGFSALLAGYRYVDGAFYDLGYSTDFWNSTEHTGTMARNLYLSRYDGYFVITSYNYGKEYGFTVRCIKDQ